MKKNIKVKSEIYEIIGEWRIDLSSKIFTGNLFDNNGIKKMNLNFKIPMSAIKKIGLEYFEECIEKDLKLEIEKKIITSTRC